MLEILSKESSICGKQNSYHFRPKPIHQNLEQEKTRLFTVAEKMCVRVELDWGSGWRRMKEMVGWSLAIEHFKPPFLAWLCFPIVYLCSNTFFFTCLIPGCLACMCDCDSKQCVNIFPMAIIQKSLRKNNNAIKSCNIDVCTYFNTRHLANIAFLMTSRHNGDFHVSRLISMETY